MLHAHSSSHYDENEPLSISTHISKTTFHSKNTIFGPSLNRAKCTLKIFTATFSMYGCVYGDRTHEQKNLQVPKLQFNSFTSIIMEAINNT